MHLYTSLDAYIRRFDIIVLRDAVAHIDSNIANAALTMMQRNLRAEPINVDDLQLATAH